MKKVLLFVFVLFTSMQSQNYHQVSKNNNVEYSLIKSKTHIYNHNLMHEVDSNRQNFTRELRKLPHIAGIIKDDFLVNDDSTGMPVQAYPSIARDSVGNFVVCYQDNRAGQGQIFSQRFDLMGSPIGNEFKVDESFVLLFQLWPSIGMNDHGNFVIVWTENKFSDENVYGKLFNNNGQPISNKFQVNDMIGDSWSESPFAVSVDNNGNFMVVWMDGRDLDIYGQYFSGDGLPIGNNIRINDDPPGNFQVWPAVAMNRTGKSIVVWFDSRNNGNSIYGQLFDTVGVKIGSEFLIKNIGTGGWNCGPSVAMDDANNFILVWNDYRNGNSDIFCQKLDSTGQPINNDFIVNDDPGGYEQKWPSVTVNYSGGFIVTWIDTRNGAPNVFGQIYDSDCQPLDNNFSINEVNGTVNSYYPGTDYDFNGNFAIVWQDQRNDFKNVWGQKYDHNGLEIGDNFLINEEIGASSQSNPVVTSNNKDQFNIVFEDYRNGDADIYYVQIDSSGEILGDNIQINTDIGSSNQQFPTISTNENGSCVIVWQESKNNGIDIYGQLIADNGQPLGTNFLINTGDSLWYLTNISTDIDSTGKFVVVWGEYSYDNETIFGLWFDSAAQPIGNKFPVTVLPNTYPDNPTVQIIDSDNFVVVWTDSRTGDYNYYGQIFDPNFIPIGDNFKINDNLNPASQGYLSLGGDSSGKFTAAWEDNRNGNWDIYCQRFDNNGQFLGENFIVNDDSGSAPQMRPSINKSGEGNFIVVWEDYRYSMEKPCIVVQRYDSNGNPIGSNYIVVDDNISTFQIMPCTGLTPERILFAWQDNRLQKGWDIYAKVTTWDWGGVTTIDKPNITLKYFTLYQNYPNPFNPVTTIKYTLLKSTKISIKIFDNLGREITTLEDGIKSPGTHEIQWNASDKSSGIYFYQLKTPYSIQIKKMLLLK